MKRDFKYVPYELRLYKCNMTKYWRGHSLLRPPIKLLEGTCPLVPRGFGAYALPEIGGSEMQFFPFCE